MPERTCSIDGCEKPVRCRGWCSAHYQLWRRNGDPTARQRRVTGSTPPECSVAGCVTGADVRGLCPTHYSRWKRTGDALGHEALPERVCKCCGSAFAPSWGQRTNVFCSESCGAKWRARQPENVAKAREYGRSAKYKARRSKYLRLPHVVARYANAEQMRRAAKLDPSADVIDREAVFERDGWRCHLCGKKVRRDVRGNHRLAPSLDHLVPLSKGGPHTWVNVRCAHFGCNCSKGARAADDQLLLL